MYNSRISLYLGQIRIKCISVSVSFLQNGHAKSACVVLVAKRSLCLQWSASRSYSYKEIFLALTCFRSFKQDDKDKFDLNVL